MLSRIAIRRIAERLCLWEFMGVVLGGWACGSATAGGELPVGWYADPIDLPGQSLGISEVQTPDGPLLCAISTHGFLFHIWNGVDLVQYPVNINDETVNFGIHWIDDGSGGAFEVFGLDNRHRFTVGSPVEVRRKADAVAWFDSGSGDLPHYMNQSGVFRSQNGIDSPYLATHGASCLPGGIAEFDAGDGLHLYLSPSARFITPSGQAAIRINGLVRLGPQGWQPMGTGFGGPATCGPQPFAWNMETLETSNGSVLVAAGNFTSVDGVPALGVAVLRSETGSWEDAGVDCREAGVMRRLDLGEGPRLYLTGRFGRTDGSEFVGIQVYDGASWRELTRASTTGTDSGGLWYFTAYTTAQGRHIYTVGRNLDVGAAAARFSARYGPICPDLDGSGTVDLADLAVVLADFGGQTQSDDSDNDGDMDLHDLALVLAGFGQSCTR